MKRVTIILHDKLYKILRAMQADLIKDSPKNISFSFVLNQELAGHFEVGIK